LCRAVLSGIVRLKLLRWRGKMRGKLKRGTLALTICAGAMAGSALADDRRDPTMGPSAAARDHETIRQMNLDQLTYVQQRDARYADEARGYAAVRRADDDRDARRRDSYAQQRDAYAQDLQHYRAERQRYDQEMAQWRQDRTDCARSSDCGY
jgi:hypothetical protein